MTFRTFRSFAILSASVLCLLVGFAPAVIRAQSSDSSSPKSQSSSSQGFQQEKAPSLVDPAGPTISLVSSEPVFLMAAALNACGYDEGLEESAPVRKRVRDEMSQALAKSEDARAKRDKVCLYIAQHRMTGTVKDIAQYISLALYLTPPPELETSAELTEMPPDSTQVVEIVPLLKDFVAAVDLHGIWLAVHPIYDREADIRRAAVCCGDRASALAAHGECPRLRDRLRGGGFTGGRADSHGRCAPHLPALRNRAAALCAGQRHRPYAADSQGGAGRSARVPLSQRHGAVDDRVPDQSDRGADHGYRRAGVHDSGGHPALRAAALRA